MSKNTIPYYERWWEEEHRDVPLKYVPFRRAFVKFSSYGEDDVDEELEAWAVCNSRNHTAIIHQACTIGQALDTLSRL